MDSSKYRQRIAPNKMDCYIYYKAAIEHAQQIQTCFACLQSNLPILALPPRLQRRPQASNSLHTWMEIYQDIPENFESILAVAVSASGILDVLASDRRLEYFSNVGEEDGFQVKSRP